MECNCTVPLYRNEMGNHHHQGCPMYCGKRLSTAKRDDLTEIEYKLELAPPVIINLGDYTLQRSEKSFCGFCGHRVHWLCPHENVINQKLDLSQFILCENCGKIVQAGRALPVAPPEPSRMKPIPEVIGLKSLEEVEKYAIIDALRHFNGHRTKTAAALKIGVRTLSMKLAKWKDQGDRSILELIGDD